MLARFAYRTSIWKMGSARGVQRGNIFHSRATRARSVLLLVRPALAPKPPNVCVAYKAMKSCPIMSTLWGGRIVARSVFQIIV